MNPDCLQIRALKASDLSDVCDLFVTSFAKESLNILFNVDMKDLREYGHDFIRFCLDQGYSCVTQSADNKVIGFFLIQDYNNTYGHKDSYPSMKNIWKSLDLLYHNIRDIPNIATAHLSCIGVHPAYTRRNIATNMFKWSETFLKNRGIQYVIVECTSKYTQNICTNLGYTILNSYYYADVYGKNPLPDQTRCILMGKQLNIE